MARLVVGVEVFLGVVLATSTSAALGIELGARNVDWYVTTLLPLTLTLSLTLTLTLTRLISVKSFKL